MTGTAAKPIAWFGFREKNTYLPNRSTHTWLRAEIDCVAGQWRRLAVVRYNVDGKVLLSRTRIDDWEPVVRASYSGAMLKAVCPAF